MEEVINLFNNKEECKFSVIIAVANFHQALLISSSRDISDVLDGDSDLYNFITNTKEIPKVRGVYTGIMKIQSFKSNHPEDPEEWDIVYSLDQLMIQEISYSQEK